MIFIGYDLGSSFVKASLFNGEIGKVINSITYPKSEMEIQVPQPGFAEQDPGIGGKPSLMLPVY